MYDSLGTALVNAKKSKLPLKQIMAKEDFPLHGGYGRHIRSAEMGIQKLVEQREGRQCADELFDHIESAHKARKLQDPSIYTLSEDQYVAIVLHFEHIVGWKWDRVMEVRFVDRNIKRAFGKVIDSLSDTPLNLLTSIAVSVSLPVAVGCMPFAALQPRLRDLTHMSSADRCKLFEERVFAGFIIPQMAEGSSGAPTLMALLQELHQKLSSLDMARLDDDENTLCRDMLEVSSALLGLGGDQERQVAHKAAVDALGALEEEPAGESLLHDLLKVVRRAPHWSSAFDEYKDCPSNWQQAGAAPLPRPPRVKACNEVYGERCNHKMPGAFVLSARTRRKMKVKKAVARMKVKKLAAKYAAVKKALAVMKARAAEAGTF